MTFSQIKILSRGIISADRKSCTALFFLLAVPVVLFTVLPYALSKIINLFIPDGEMICILTVSVVLFGALFFFSSFYSGKCAYFGFYDKRNKGKKAAFWFRPSKSLKSVFLCAAVFLCRLFFLVMFLLPAAAVLESAVLLALDGGIEFNFFICCVAGAGVLFLIGLIFYFLFSQRFFLVRYLFIQNPKMKIREAFSVSRKLMNGKIKRTALFKLSFVPWFLLCAVVVTVPYVWSYYNQSCAVLARTIRNEI